MKKTNFMTALLLIAAVLLMVACTQGPITQDPNASVPTSSQVPGAVEDNNVFGDGGATSAPSTGATQPTTAPSTVPTTVPTTAATQPGTVATQPTTQPITQPTQPATQATQPTTAPQDPVQMDYKTFINMTAAEQRAFQDSFSSIEAFFNWLNAAKAAYDQANPPIEVGGDGTVTLPTTP